MLTNHSFMLRSSILTAALAFVVNAHALELIINANQDTYIRSGASQRDNNFNGDYLVSGAGWISLVQFDLSNVVGMNITSAYIRGYLIEDPDDDYTSAPYEHRMWLTLLDPNNPTYDDGLDETTMTYNIYTNMNQHNTWNSDQLLMESLGYYEADADIPNEYKNFGVASATDLAALNGRVSLANESQRFALFEIDRRSQWRWWDDHEVNFDENGEPIPNSNNPMQLVLEVAESSVQPGDWNGDGFVNTADYVMWRDNPDGFEGDPAGYDKWKVNFGAGPGGTGAVAGAVPEPGAWSLMATALTVIVGGILRRRRR